MVDEVTENRRSRCAGGRLRKGGREPRRSPVRLAQHGDNGRPGIADGGSRGANPQGHGGPTRKRSHSDAVCLERILPRDRAVKA
jgi:hypothetical protein